VVAFVLVQPRLFAKEKNWFYTPIKIKENYQN
jgi:hypothetical protein